MRIKKGDQVKIVKGKDRGKTGRVEEVFPGQGRVRVGGINVVKRHRRPRGRIAGGIITLAVPIRVENVKLICRHCNKPARVGYKLLEDGKRVRVCKKCQGTLD